MIPDQLQNYPLIRVCRPSCRSHNNCSNEGKRPVTSTKDENPINRIKSWINRGGNYGTVARSDNDLVIFDSDSERFSKLLSENLPMTFRVESGGSGHGQHWYFRCATATRQTGWKEPEGSVRVDNWHAVGPGSIHPNTGEKYTVIDDVEIATVTQSKLDGVCEILDDLSSENVQSGGGGDLGGSPPSSHSEAVLSDLNFIRRDDRRSEISEILTTDSEHSRRVWMVGWLHAAAGLSTNEIVNLIMNNAQWPKLDRATVRSQTESVISSSRSSRGTHYSNFGTADMDGDSSERRKTESDDGASDNQEVSSMEDNVRNKSTVKRDDGRFARSGIVEAENNGDTWEYAGVVFGTVQDDDDELGKVVEFETNKYGDRNYRNLGNRSADDLRLAAEALEKLADEIEDN